jgi:hypothetical protein
MIEKALDAHFVFPPLGESTDVWLCEGYEDAHSVWRYGKRHGRVIGIPGASTLQHLAFAKGTKVHIVRDGDAQNSHAAKVTQDAIDALILAGVDVHATTTPPLGWDANHVLQERGVGGSGKEGDEGLREFLDKVSPAELSLRGEIERLAQHDELEYLKIRKAEAKRPIFRSLSLTSTSARLATALPLQRSCLLLQMKIGLILRIRRFG